MTLSKTFPTNSKLYLLIVMGALSAFGPFVTDFYLPALPQLSVYFSTSTSLVQLSLTFSMIGLAVGQLFIGPCSDKYGRRMPLLLSIAFFIITTMGCLVAQSIGLFIAFRFLQGIAGAGGLVIAKSVATDLYEGKALARYFTLLTSVQGIAPVCAPVFGGLLLTFTCWKGVFAALLLIGLLLLFVLFRFKESLSIEKRAKGNILSTYSSYLPVLKNRKYMSYVYAQSFANGMLFCYISASPFIYQSFYHLSPMSYSLCFALNAFGIMLGSLFSSVFQTEQKALGTGTVGFAFMSLVTAFMLVTGACFLLVELSFFLLLVFLGMILLTTTTLALDLERHHSGNASAILGFSAFLFGGIVSPLVGLGNMMNSAAIILVICCGSVLLIVKRIKS